MPYIVKKRLNTKKGVYISLEATYLSKVILYEFAKELASDLKKKFNKTFEVDKKTIDEAHITLIYSKKPFVGLIEFPYSGIKSKIIGFKKFDNKEDEIYALTLKLDCKKCKELHEFLLKKYNFSFEYKEFIPHLTISYKAKDITQEMLNEIEKEYKQKHKFVWLGFDKVKIEELDENWADNKN